MGIGDAIQSLFGGDEEPEDSYEAAFEQEAVLPDTAETTLGREGDARDVVEGSLRRCREPCQDDPGL